MKGIGWMLRFMMAGLETTKFVFWDNTLDELLSMTACGLGDPQEYPEAMDDLMERKLAFRVKWQPGWGSLDGGVKHLCPFVRIAKSWLPKCKNNYLLQRVHAKPQKPFN
ncbi:hypothetical protein A2U01_0002645 [Trifolium medium]|uniref:Uncharacterized protein n=1 Tax=Trifolium medium TaxID=97028 RepID=A0A392M3C7_9FABA|nr:hypothetical protein [Trifolium medium]